MIVLARHGETPANRRGLILGRADPELTDHGRSQAATMARALAREHPVAVVSSPLRRARQTAESIASATGLAMEVDERLIEVDWGELEGRPYLGMAPAGLIAAESGSPVAEGGESLASLRERVAPCCEELLERAGSGLVVAVSHVSPIKAAVAWSLGVEDRVAWRMRLSLASITRIARRGDGLFLVSFNEVGHLSGPPMPAPG